MTVKEYNKSVDLYSDNIYRFLLKNTRDKDLAQDIVQESYMKLWDKVELVNFEKVKSYLFTEETAECLDWKLPI
jgi:RNA polymerase sigma-70 factor (ECF subfamily)